MSDAGEQEGWFDRILGRWWGKCLLGVLIILGGYLIFGEMSKLETGEKESMRVNWLLAALYNLGGKWAGAGLLWLIGGISMIVGIRQAIVGKKPEGTPPEQSGK